MILGIDAFNLRGGGGVTHIKEILAAANPAEYGFKKVVIWGTSNTMALLHNKPWLEKIEVPHLNGNALQRFYWHIFLLKKCAKAAGCDLVFSPGGIVAHRFKPAVTMCRNMLPFEFAELKRYGPSLIFFKLLLIRFFQIRSFRGSAGIIFLTNFAKEVVGAQIGKTSGHATMIPHGVDSNTGLPKDSAGALPLHKSPNNLNILYVSTISPYKHQDKVIEAVSNLVSRGFKLQLHLVGGDGGSLRNVTKQIEDVDPNKKFITYHGEVAGASLKHFYNSADVAVFASTCENMPNILVEKMAAGLPIVCSEKAPMGSILQDAGEYFNSDNVASLEATLERVVSSSELQRIMSRKALDNSKKYSWNLCSNSTFNFLSRVAKNER